MPLMAVSFSGSDSSTCSVSMPNLATSFSAVAGRCISSPDSTSARVPLRFAGFVTWDISSLIQFRPWRPA